MTLRYFIVYIQFKRADTVSDDRILGEPDVTHYLDVSSNRVSKWSFYDPADYPNPPLTDVTRRAFTIKDIAFKTPSSPPLTQPEVMDEDEFCDVEDEVNEKCLDEYCSCVQTMKVGLGQVRL